MENKKPVPDGLGVRIPGFHPGGPGSIPGLGVFLFLTGSLFMLASLTQFSISRCLSSAGLAADRINVANCWSPSCGWIKT